MSEPTKAIYIEAEESLPEVEMEAEEATAEVAKVLAEAPKSPRMLRPKPTPIKESTKDNKGKQPPMRASLRRNMPKPTA